MIHFEQEIPVEKFKEEMPEKFEALVVLGEGWREYLVNWKRYLSRNKSPDDKGQLHLSIESKMSVLAAGEMFKSGLTNKIIFSTGQTAGKEQLSEAEEMMKYLRRKYPDIPEEAIIIETESIDTAENAEQVARLLEKYNFKNVALLTAKLHLPRSKKLFEAYGMKVHGLPSEEVLKNRSLHYKKFIEKYSKSGRAQLDRIKEIILRNMLIIDAKARIPRLLAKQLRSKS